MRLPRVTLRPIRDWALFGRPIGEWVYLALLGVSGVNSLAGALGGDVGRPLETAIVVGQLVMGVAALGVVASMLLARLLGLRLLWLWAVATTATVPLAARTYGSAPTGDVAIAGFSAAVLCAFVVWYGRRRLHAAITRRVWPEVIAEHSAAADEFAQTIQGLTPAQWTARTRAESWSAAEITDHLARTYSQFAGESRGKNSLRVRLRLPQLVLARAFVKPRLLRGAPFPKARAPRALRPGAGPESPADGVALFRASGAACVRDLGILVERRPHRRLVHPYLGALPLYEIVRFAAQHVRHHHRQLLTTIAATRQGTSDVDTP
jgi:hypothetical protein